VCTVYAQDGQEGGILNLLMAYPIITRMFLLYRGKTCLVNTRGNSTNQGLSNELNNIVGNKTQSLDPNFEIKSIREYDSNSSDWTKINPFDVGRTG
jgi:hypothetical protein